MEKTTKLSDKQREVIKRMRTGLNLQHHRFIGYSSVVYGGTLLLAENFVNKGTFNSLRKRELIYYVDRHENSKSTSVYSLTELGKTINID